MGAYLKDQRMVFSSTDMLERESLEWSRIGASTNKRMVFSSIDLLVSLGKVSHKESLYGFGALLAQVGCPYNDFFSYYIVNILLVSYNLMLTS